MSEPASTIEHRLIACLSEQCRALHAMRDLLEQERSALIDRDADALLELARGKDALRDRLVQLENKRKELLAGCGAPIDPSVHSQWFSQPDRSPAVRQGWAELLATLREARSRNYANGALLAEQHRMTQQSLRFLQGHADSLAVYGDRGRQVSAPMRRMLGTA